VDDAAQVVAPARHRASALADGDTERLTTLLHAEFHWTSHVGERFDRTEYVRRNTQGDTVWRSQELTATEVVVVGDTAVLTTTVTDVVLTETGEAATFRMPVTQVWVRDRDRWLCLVGHAGPRLSP
jgi:ketosteroid isomerase-like protein